MVMFDTFHFTTPHTKIDQASREEERKKPNRKEENKGDSVLSHGPPQRKVLQINTLLIRYNG